MHSRYFTIFTVLVFFALYNLFADLDVSRFLMHGSVIVVLWIIAAVALIVGPLMYAARREAVCVPGLPYTVDGPYHPWLARGGIAMTTGGGLLLTYLVYRLF